MTLKEILEFRKMVPGVCNKIKNMIPCVRKSNTISLFGFTSTSLDENQALSFSWENKKSGHHKVLFHITWNYPYSHYYLDAGAYDHEKEVLLFDGATVKVISVKDINDIEGNKLYTLI